MCSNQAPAAMRVLQAVVIALVSILSWNHAQTLVTAHAAVRSKGEGWEYKTIVKALSYRGALFGSSQVENAKCYDGSTELKCDTMLNNLGAQGWDLAIAFPESSTGGDKGWAGVTTTEVFIFKRVKDQR
jgi:hypothetical protein